LQQIYLTTILYDGPEINWRPLKFGGPEL
jgi:hypothetical protein